VRKGRWRCEVRKGRWKKCGAKIPGKKELKTEKPHPP